MSTPDYDPNDPENAPLNPKEQEDVDRQDETVRRWRDIHQNPV